MTFEDRKKAIASTKRLIEKNKAAINEHPFVVQKTKLLNKHTNTIQQLLQECTHDEVERKSEYYDGSYFDKAHTEYWVVCTLCGAKSERTTEIHSWYG